MGMQFAIEADLARAARNLLAAWESGDRRLLEAAVRESANGLGGAPRASAHLGEVRELLLAVTESMELLLSASPGGDFRQGSQGKVCYELLRHAQGTAASAARL